MSMIDDAPEYDVCERCDLVSYPLQSCGILHQRLCVSCTIEHANDDKCPSCIETCENADREWFARAQR